MGRGQSTRSEYFEGTLQLRNPSKELIDYVHWLIETAGDVTIAKEKKVPGGIDLYVSNNKWLRRVGEKLKSRFDGIAKNTSKLFTQDRMTSKEVHRGTTLFRLASFKRGQRFIVYGTEMEVLTVGGKVVLRETASGKKRHIKFEEVEKAHARA